MAKQLTLLTVHAHPDDEAIYTGGALAYYSSQGIRTVLVTCTRGEAGPDMRDQKGADTGFERRTEEQAERLAKMREEELQCSISILGVDIFHQLGYRDSGLTGWKSNDHPKSFYRADIHEASEKLVALVRLERPEVLVTYDERGMYGHPDHIKANEITVAAFQAAGDPQAYPEAGLAWQPSKLYYVYSRPGIWQKVYELMRKRGARTPLDDPEFDPGHYQDDPNARTKLCVEKFLDRKIQALQCHRTQASVYRDFLSLPRDFLTDFAGNEWFILIESKVGGPAEGEQETDLFAGLR